VAVAVTVVSFTEVAVIVTELARNRRAGLVVASGGINRTYTRERGGKRPGNHLALIDRDGIVASRIVDSSKRNC